MKRKKRLASWTPSVSGRRTILYVDPDSSCATALQDVWMQLRLADDLHIVNSQEAALEFLDFVQGREGEATMAAVVLDPEATGEETGQFVREVRKYCGKNAVPIVFWSRDSDTYKVLEGRGAESVLKKPMVLRLIQALDSACQLRVQSFHPYRGSSSLVNPNPQTNIGITA